MIRTTNLDGSVATRYLAVLAAFAVVFALFPLVGFASAQTPGDGETFDVTLSGLNETNGEGQFGFGEPTPGSEPTPGAEPTPDEEPTPSEVSTRRLRGENRFGTARAIALDAFPNSDRVIIASGEQFPDALAGSFLAGAFNAPVLLVGRGTVPEDTEEALDEIGATELVVLGGPNAILPSVRTSLTSGDRTIVEEFAGETRFETAAEIAMSDEPIGSFEGERTAIVATGQVFADALVFGTISFSENFPILLTPTAGLHPAADAALDSLDIERVIIAGGPMAVSAAAEAQIRAKDIEVTRVNVPGGSRFDTSTAAADFAKANFGYDFTEINVATGFNFPDALTIAPRGGLNRNPLILTNGTNDVPVQATTDFLRENACEILSLVIAGGPEAVTDANLNALADAANDCDDAGVDPTPDEQPLPNPQAAQFVEGSATITVEDDDSISFTVDFSDVTGPFDPASGFHLHEGRISENGPIVVTLATGAQLEAAAGQMLEGNVPSGDFDVAELLADPENFYLNLHSSAFRAGAIRGQFPDGGQDEIIRFDADSAEDQTLDEGDTRTFTAFDLADDGCYRVTLLNDEVFVAEDGATTFRGEDAMGRNLTVIGAVDSTITSVNGLPPVGMGGGTSEAQTFGQLRPVPVTGELSFTVTAGDTDESFTPVLYFDGACTGEERGGEVTRLELDDVGDGATAIQAFGLAGSTDVSAGE